MAAVQRLSLAELAVSTTQDTQGGDKASAVGWSYCAMVILGR